MSQGKPSPVPRGLSPGGPPQGGAEPSDPDRALLPTGDRSCWKLGDRLRPFQSWRVAQCRRWTEWGHDHISITKGDTGWKWGHIHRCASVWVCPVCATAISLQRTEEISTAVDWWRGQSHDIRMMTITIRHNLSQDLVTLRRGLCRAWRKLQQSRKWRDLREEAGIDHLIRGIEVNLGENGWHPHVHVVLFARFPDVLDQWQQRLTTCWRWMVRKELGRSCVPSKKRALAISSPKDGAYVAKRMGMEISSTRKRTSDGSMSAWELAERVASGEVDGEIWKTYFDGTRGCHQLQWSRGLRELVQPKETDLDCVRAVEDGSQAEREVIAAIPRETWREAANEPEGLWDLYSFGKTAKDLTGHEARAWLLAYFENRAGNGSADWRWVDGRAYLRWDTS